MKIAHLEGRCIVCKGFTRREMELKLYEEKKQHIRCPRCKAPMSMSINRIEQKE